MKSILIWLAVIVVIGGSIWGLTKLQQRYPTTTPTSSVANVDPVSSADWIEGNKDSKTTLIEYGDFQCPACGAYYPMVKKLVDDNGKDFRFVYRYFPLQQHAHARDAAYAAQASGKQGKFWEMHSMLYEHQNDWSGANNAKDIFEGYARTLNLNIGQFDQDRDSQDTKNVVEKFYQSGVNAGVNSTPTFYLNNKKIQPASYQEFVDLIKTANH